MVLDRNENKDIHGLGFIEFLRINIVRKLESCLLQRNLSKEREREEGEEEEWNRNGNGS